MRLGTCEIVRHNRGEVDLWTGNALYRIRKGRDKGFVEIPEVPGTGLRIAIDTNRPIDLGNTWIASTRSRSYFDLETGNVDGMEIRRVGEICRRRRIRRRSPKLLSRHGEEMERLQAARDSQSLDYRIRNYYPHPIALRREALLQKSHGKERVDEILKCAEHLLRLLMIVSLTQQSGIRRLTRILPSPGLVGMIEKAMHIDWGKSWAILEEGVSLSRKNRTGSTQRSGCGPFAMTSRT